VASEHIRISLERAKRQVLNLAVRVAEVHRRIAGIKPENAGLQGVGANTRKLTSTVLVTGVALGLVVLGLGAAMLAHGGPVPGSGTFAREVTWTSEQDLPLGLRGTISE
jgi:hypothetical protein